MINSIEINGYRLLNDFSADFGNLTVVIGANSVGKSTLLDCLQCISQCVEFPLNSALALHWGIISLLSAKELTEQILSWKVTLKKPDKTIWAQLPIEDNIQIVYEVLLKADSSGQTRVEHEVLHKPEPASGHKEPRSSWHRPAHRKSLVQMLKNVQESDLADLHRSGELEELE